MQDYKFIISIFTVLLVIISNWSYFRGMLYGTVRPHMYTFLIWIITQWIAVFGMIYGWAKWWIVWPTLSLLCMVWIVFLIWKKKTVISHCSQWYLCTYMSGYCSHSLVSIWRKIDISLLGYCCRYLLIFSDIQKNNDSPLIWDCFPLDYF